MAQRVFGASPAVAEGTTFPGRRELADAGVYRPLEAAIIARVAYHRETHEGIAS